MAKKLYPFSMNKHHHSLELARNILFCQFITEDNVSPKMRSWAIDRRERITQIIMKADRHNIAWLNGEEYGFAQKVVAWATSFRASMEDMNWEERNETLHGAKA